MLLLSEDKLIEFLMGLNNRYDHVENKILFMNSLLGVNKATLWS